MDIRLLVLDVDGVLTDGTILYSAEGEELKAFNVQDGLGIKLLMRSGFEVAVISGRGSAPLERRLDDLGIYHRRFKCKDKVAALEDICDEVGCMFDQVAFMGDDLIDLKVMRAVRFAVAPPNAVPEVLEAAHHVTERLGGHGAVRELCDYLAALKGIRFADYYVTPEED